MEEVLWVPLRAQPGVSLAIVTASALGDNLKPSGYENHLVKISTKV